MNKDLHLISSTLFSLFIYNFISFNQSFFIICFFLNLFQSLSLSLSPSLPLSLQEGKSGNTLLHCAISAQKLDLVRFLIRRFNCSLNVKNYAGLTPIQLICSLIESNPNNNLKAISNELIEYNGGRCSPIVDLDSDTDYSSGSESNDECNLRS